MLRTQTLATTLVVLFTLNFALAQETTKKTRVALPAGWTKLGLSKDQTTKVYAVRTTYQTKIQELEAQILKLRQEERSKMVEVLTPAQKETLRKLLGVDDDTKTKSDQK